MSKEEFNLDYKKAFEVFKDTMREGNYLLSVKVALEKQIPKKPIPVKDNLMGRLVSFTCPCCFHEDLGNNEYRFKHCEECGQALDWSETE